MFALIIIIEIFGSPFMRNASLVLALFIGTAVSAAIKVSSRLNQALRCQLPVPLDTVPFAEQERRWGLHAACTHLQVAAAWGRLLRWVSADACLDRPSIAEGS